ncbi:hypothetical protein BD626DRAFT_547068 [Schizophyllum amplum]|uniref:Phosphatidic acid phosphatase type 2/haloperoxidase domain-containing protein n=1 Tax=Schizophyllum amplum TaxID=97359 RepID=A0A550CIN2_9AGAR|nr:hypothetical protein BD626DRAFT_547068 [Auriculariopsis ampla]
MNGLGNEKEHRDGRSTPLMVAEDIYEATLSPWRATIRRRVLKAVEVESKIIARMQARIRSPLLDSYFLYTSALGTHTFFTILLPTFFFFGNDRLGRSLCLVVSLGVYLTSYIKDLVCSPRPFAPPVQRLTIGTHHLEYGFPSTHSANSVSIALWFYVIVHGLVADDVLGDIAYMACTALLTVYAFSIVFGRLYTAMHCFTDCAAGVAVGVWLWWFETSWDGFSLPMPSVVVSSLATAYAALPGLVSAFFSTIVAPVDGQLALLRGADVGGLLERWVHTGGVEVPFIIIPLCLLAINQHPEPVDDCPCFEDAIAIGSVVVGALVGRWGMAYFGLQAIGMSSGTPSRVLMPGSGWVYNATMALEDPLAGWMQEPRTLVDVSVWWGMAVLKMTVGIVIIFAWRLFAKSALHIILPPVFRLLSKLFDLPNRRFYTPATDYKNVPSEFVDERGGFRLHAIPSVIDLPGMAGMEVGGVGSGVSGHAVARRLGESEMKLRQGGGVTTEKANNTPLPSRPGTPSPREEETMVQRLKHYDADVLTKFAVYAGIAILACEMIPMMFEVLGWGVRSSPF